MEQFVSTSIGSCGPESKRHCFKDEFNQTSFDHFWDISKLKQERCIFRWCTVALTFGENWQKHSSRPPFFFFFFVKIGYFIYKWCFLFSVNMLNIIIICALRLAGFWIGGFGLGESMDERSALLTAITVCFYLLLIFPINTCRLGSALHSVNSSCQELNGIGDLF